MNLRLLVFIMIALYLLVELLEVITEVADVRANSRSQKTSTAEKKAATSTAAATATAAAAAGVNIPGSVPGELATTTRKKNQLKAEVAIEEAIRTDDVSEFLKLISHSMSAMYSVKLHGDLVFQFVNQDREWTEETDTMFKALLSNEKLGARINGDGNTWSPLKASLHVEGKALALQRLIKHPFIHPYVTVSDLSCKAIGRSRLTVAPAVTFVIDPSNPADDKCFQSLLVSPGGVGNSQKTKAITLAEYEKMFGGKKGGAIALHGEDTAIYQQRLDERAAVSGEAVKAAAEAKLDATATAGQDESSVPTSAAAPATVEFSADSPVMNPTSFSDPFVALYVYLFGTSTSAASATTVSSIPRLLVYGSATFLFSGLLSGGIILLTILAPTPPGGQVGAEPLAQRAGGPMPAVAPAAEPAAGEVNAAAPPPGVVV